MRLQLYDFGNLFDPRPFRWDAFIAGFAPMPVSLNPANGNPGHWRFEHPTHPIRFYAPVVTKMMRKMVSSVHFDAEDVDPVGFESWWLEHPLWTGLFNAVTSGPAILVVEPPGIGGPVAKGIIVARPELLTELPSWAQNLTFNDHVFVAPEREDFDRLIAEAWDLSFDVRYARQPRDGWADEVEQDEEAREAFENYIAGKRGKVAIWGGQAIEQPGTGGSFLDKYGVWVDWRDFDDEIVKHFAKQLKNPRLDVEMRGEDLLISFGSAQRLLTSQEIGKEQYQTIRAMNEVLAPDFEVRSVRKEADGDTHCFVFAPSKLWKHLEDLDREKLERKIKIIDSRDGFRS